MATLAAPNMSALQKERAFFFYMALAITATVAVGFGFFFAIGASSFGAPWWVHLHAATMMSWVALYLAQNFMVYRGVIAGHRQLGMIGAALSVWMLGVGIAVTAMDVRTDRVPPFFEPGFFLVMDWLNMIVFAGLVWAALRLRANADWHKRLMLGAMLNLIGPALGRIIMPLVFDQRGVWLISLALLGYFGVAMLYDVRTRGAVHPAYFWGAGMVVGMTVLCFLLAPLPPVTALAAALAG
jgi:hypothetical protein